MVSPKILQHSTTQDPDLLHNVGACTLVWISTIVVYYGRVVMMLNDLTVCVKINVKRN